MSTAKERALTPQDVMLVSPTVGFPPLSASTTAAELSAPLREQGFSTGYQDYSLSYMNETAIAAAAGSRVVGITANTSLMPVALALADVFKAINPRLHVVMGGYHPTDAPFECFMSPSVDYVLRGESDLNLVTLVSELLKSRATHSVPSLVYKSGDRVIQTPTERLIADLDALPLPDFQIIDWRQYREPEKCGVVPVRGCFGKCGFCSPGHFWNHQMRFKSARRVMREYDLLLNETGVKATRIQADFFTMHPQWGLAIAQYFGRTGCRWTIQTRAGAISNSNLALLLENGLKGIFSGIEFGSESLRESISKSFDHSQFSQSVAITNRFGASYDISLLLGYIGETESSVTETRAFAEEAISLGVRKVKLFIPAPFPGTQFTNSIVTSGLLHVDRIHGYESIDPSTALHSTGTMNIHLSPNRIEELYEDFSIHIAGAQKGSNSLKGQSFARQIGDERFQIPDHCFGKYDHYFQERKRFYGTCIPAYLIHSPPVSRMAPMRCPPSHL